MKYLSLEEKLILQAALLSFITAKKAILKNTNLFQHSLNKDIEIAEKLQKLFSNFED